MTTIDGDAARRLDAHLQHRIDTGSLPGCTTHIWLGGELVHSNALGQRDIERALPVAEDTVFRIFSMTKPIASVALMQCYERGLIQLNDPVHEYIPAWKELQVTRGDSGMGMPIVEACARPMTVRDLMTHQSGLPSPPSRGLGRPLNGTLADMVAELAGVPLAFQPGEHFSYGVSTDVVGHLVELVSGMPLDDYLAQHIYEPLGMTETAFWVPPERIDRFAALYNPSPSGLQLMDDPQSSAMAEKPTFLSGAGGLTSTALDYARFALMLRGGGAYDGVRVIGRKTLELMAMNHLTGGRTVAEASLDPFFGDYHGQGFGLGFGITLDPVGTQLSGSTGEFYWTGAAGSLVFVDPVEDLTVLFMTQVFPNILGAGYRNPYGWREIRALVYALLT
jgi:CubicO group peptidase (beta-lactamase class C family)